MHASFIPSVLSLKLNYIKSNLFYSYQHKLFEYMIVP